MGIRILPSLVAALAGVAAASAQTHPNVLLILADDLGVDKLACYGAANAAPMPVVDALAANGMRFTRAHVNPACSPTRGAMLTGRYSFRTGVPGTLPYGAPGIDTDEIQLATPLTAAGYSTAMIGKWHLGTRYGTSTPNQLGWPHFAGCLDAALIDYYQWPKVVDGSVINCNHYATVDQVDDALMWINAQSGPWALVLSLFSPHSPFHAPPAGLHTQNLAGLDPATNPVPFHRAMLQAADHEIGRLLVGIGASRLAQTNILFLGDNGTDGAVFEPPLLPNHAKGALFDGGSHVPLIVCGPAVAARGSVCNAFVSAVDVFPTILDLAGSTFPLGFDQSLPLDGISFRPLLAGTRASIRDHVYVEISGTPLGEGYSVRDAQWLLVRYTRVLPQHEELYDLAADPAESNDLLAHPLAPSAQTAYQRLAGWLDDLRHEGWVSLFGNGCPGSLGVPALRSQTPPTLGTNFFVYTGNVPPATP